MAFDILIKPPAFEDWDNTIENYNDRKAGLGFEVYEEIRLYLENVQQNPLHYQRRYPSGIRVRFTPRFHFGIFYTLENNTVVVHAILNAREDDRKALERK